MENAQVGVLVTFSLFTTTWCDITDSAHSLKALRLPAAHETLGAATVPVWLVEVPWEPEPDPEPRETLPDTLDPVPERASSCISRSSNSLEVDRASWFTKSLGASSCGHREHHYRRRNPTFWLGTSPSRLDLRLHHQDLRLTCYSPNNVFVPAQDYLLSHLSNPSNVFNSELVAG